MSIGTELSANIDPGITIQNIVKVYILNAKVFTSGDKKNINEQILITNTYPNRLHSLVEDIKAMTIGITEIKRRRELVCGVIFVP